MPSVAENEKKIENAFIDAIVGYPASHEKDEMPVSWYGEGEYGEGLQHAWLSTPIFLNNPKPAVVKSCGEQNNHTEIHWWSLNSMKQPAKLECGKCRIEVEKAQILWKKFKDEAILKFKSTNEAENTDATRG